MDCFVSVGRGEVELCLVRGPAEMLLLEISEDLGRNALKLSGLAGFFILFCFFSSPKPNIPRPHSCRWHHMSSSPTAPRPRLSAHTGEATDECSWAGSLKKSMLYQIYRHFMTWICFHAVFVPSCLMFELQILCCQKRKKKDAWLLDKKSLCLWAFSLSRLFSFRPPPTPAPAPPCQYWGLLFSVSSIQRLKSPTREDELPIWCLWSCRLFQLLWNELQTPWGLSGGEITCFALMS